MTMRGLDRYARICLVFGLLVPEAGRALAAPRAPAGGVEKVRAILISFDRASRMVTYERANTKLTADVAEEALPKFAALRSGQVMEMELQSRADGSLHARDVKKPGHRVEYLLFLVGALIVQLIPGG